MGGGERPPNLPILKGGNPKISLFRGGGVGFTNPKPSQFGGGLQIPKSPNLRPGSPKIPRFGGPKTARFGGGSRTPNSHNFTRVTHPKISRFRESYKPRDLTISRGVTNPKNPTIFGGVELQTPNPTISGGGYKPQKSHNSKESSDPKPHNFRRGFSKPQNLKFRGRYEPQTLPIRGRGTPKIPPGLGRLLRVTPGWDFRGPPRPWGCLGWPCGAPRGIFGNRKRRGRCFS